ncbi:MAG TPA: carboxypeptidase regulatory-like domain-containing protein [Terriglobia bacterium]|nr:carboxypeptidase regulatory-like domain-containing protein [Terriglobia bacterium]
MKLTDSYDGSGAPFEGDQTLVWASLPAGARVSKARLTLTPAAPDGGELFREEIRFTGASGDWGATKTNGLVNSQPYVEVDFHKRRTLVAVIGADAVLNNASLQIDMGGVSVEINDKGAIKTPTDANPFKLPGDGTLPGLTVSKFRLIAGAAGSSADIAGVVVRSIPANISARLGKMAPFWSRVGDLTAPDQSPDFSDLLQVFLNNAGIQNGFYRVPLVVHSDVVARLQATLEVEYLQQASVLPEGVKEVVLPFDFGSLPKTRPDVLQVSLPPNARVTPATSAKVLGAFHESRVVFGPTGEVTPAGAVSIKPTDSQAQIFALEAVASATSVDILIMAEPPGVRLAVDVRADFDGKPDATSFLGNRVELTIPSRPDKQPAWVNVPLTGDIHFQAKDTAKYWLVLQTLQGEAAWSVQPASDGKPIMQHTQDGGLSWRETPAPPSASPPSGFFRLREIPDEFQMPVDLQVGAGRKAQRVKLDRFQPLGRVDFTLAIPEVAAGFNAFLAGASSGGCAEAEHLVNGSFEQWAIVGSDPGQASLVQSMTSSMEVTAIAVSGNGRTAYAVVAITGGVTKLKAGLDIVDVACNRILRSIPLTLSARPDALLLYPDSTRALVIGSDELELVDLVKATSIGKTTISASSLALAFSADGNRLFVAKMDRTAGTEISGTVVDAQGAVIPGAKVTATNGATGQSKTTITDSTGNYILTIPTSGTYDVHVDAQGFASAEGKDLKINFGDHKKFNFILAVGGPSQMVEVTAQTALFSIDTIDTEPAVLAGNLSGKMWTMNILLDGRVTAMAASHRTLYVLKNDASQAGAVVFVDLQTGSLDPEKVQVGREAVAIALTPDGSQAIVANRLGNSATLINLQNRTASTLDLTNKAPSESDPQPLSPVAVAVSPDGRRAFVAGNVEPFEAGPEVAINATQEPAAAVAIINMIGKSEVSAVSLQGPLSSLAITPQGDEVYVGGDGPQPMVYIPLGVRMPADWFLTSGTVQLACLPGLTAAHIVALLGDVSEEVPTQPSAISQVVPVSEGCTYEFSFEGLANTPQAVAEILWRGESCQSLREDSIVIPQFDPGNKTSPEMMFRSTSQSFSGAAATGPEFRLIKKMLRLSPPPGANAAEVRFRVSDGAAIVAAPSLMSTSETVVNGDFKSLQQGIAEQWTLSPADARGLSVTPQDLQVRLGNNGPAPVDLVQEMPVPTGQGFTLAFTGRALAATADESPRLELHWLKDDSSETGTPASQDILPASFDSRPLAGKVPDGAAKAALHLHLPSGAALVVDQISLQVPQTTAVPVSFVAQSPGELRISGAQVTYDIAPAAPPPVPATGLCPPTPPSDATAAKPSADCYCSCCQGPVQMAKPFQAKTPAGRPMTVGECPDCGETVVRGGGIPAPSALPAPIRVVTVTPHPTSVTPLPPLAASATTLKIKPPALTDVEGIGPARAQQLSQVGIKSVQDLAAAEPVRVAVALRGVTVESARVLVTHAQKLLSGLPRNGS